MKRTEYQERLINELLSNVRSEGYSDGYNTAKKDYGQSKGIAQCTPATPEEIQEHGTDLVGWCSCGGPINGRWSGLINFCPWCGKIIEWPKSS